MFSNEPTHVDDDVKESATWNSFEPMPVYLRIVWSLYCRDNTFANFSHHLAMVKDDFDEDE